MGLKLWKDLCESIHIASINDDNVYTSKIVSFVSKFKLFFTGGGKSFLKELEAVGDDDKFYLYCIRCYIPTIASRKFNTHHLSV